MRLQRDAAKVSWSRQPGLHPLSRALVGIGTERAARHSAALPL
jgi:hypothetical protein